LARVITSLLIFRLLMIDLAFGFDFPLAMLRAPRTTNAANAMMIVMISILSTFLFYLVVFSLFFALVMLLHLPPSELILLLDSGSFVFGVPGFPYDPLGKAD